MSSTKHRMARVNGINMHIAEQGQGPLILLCHGFPETSYSWRHQLHALAQAGFHAVAPDMRGYGKTDSPDDVASFSVFDLVGDLVGLLDALGASQAIVVGNDWGATVAWQAALMRPDRFRGVVALGVPWMARAPVPPTQLFPQTPEAQLYVLHFQDPGVAEPELEKDVRETLLKIMFAASGEAGARQGDDGTPNPFGMVSRTQGMLASLPVPASLPPWLTSDDLDTFAEAFTHSGFTGGLNYYRSLDRNWALQAALTGLKVEVPALYMVGSRDPGLNIPGMREIISAMPQSVCKLQDAVILPECGHWLPQERPSELSAAIVEFAERLGRC